MLLKWNFLHWLKFTVIRGLGNEIGNKFLKNTKRMLNIYCAKWNSCQVCNRWTIWKKLLISSKVHKSIWHSMRRISSEVFAFWSPFNSDWQFISNHLSIFNNNLESWNRAWFSQLQKFWWRLIVQFLVSIINFFLEMGKINYFGWFHLVVVTIFVL